jgi:hypothetical protein
MSKLIIFSKFSAQYIEYLWHFFYVEQDEDLVVKNVKEQPLMLI